MSRANSAFPFAQFEFAGALGIDDGRYPARTPAPGSDGSTEAVLVARTTGVAVPRRRRGRSKPRDSDPDAIPKVPLTQLTVIEAEPVPGDPAAWLDTLRRDRAPRDEFVDRALDRVRRALGALRVTIADPGIPEPSLERAVAVRVGFGSGDDLVDGRYSEALDIQTRERRGRVAALRPQERVAAILGGRTSPLACEELLLRAHSDVDAGRLREAALQVRIGLEALLAERGALEAPAQAEDLAFLAGRREPAAAAAREALAGELTGDRAAEVAETLAACERVLRRRALA